MRLKNSINKHELYRCRTMPLVYDRAKNCCEYCLLNEKYAIKRHEIDHVIAEKHGGETIESNLCLSCAECNRYKGSDLASVDPQTNEPAFLFRPRLDKWSEHFKLEGATIRPLTIQGRATARLLHFNYEDRVAERATLIILGRYP